MLKYFSLLAAMATEPAKDMKAETAKNNNNNKNVIADALKRNDDATTDLTSEDEVEEIEDDEDDEYEDEIDEGIALHFL